MFCQRLPSVSRRYGRQIDRLVDIISAVGYVAGGVPAARLLSRLAIRISDDSVRRRVIRAALGQADEPVVNLGVDDWAWRKYQTYGTILVDLDGTGSPTYFVTAPPRAWPYG